MKDLTHIFGAKKDNSQTSETKETTPPEKVDTSSSSTTEAKEDLSASNSTEKKKTESVEDQYSSWTKDDFVKEIKAARSEAAKNRVEKKEKERELSEEYERKLKELEGKFAPLADAKKELENYKERDADKKRSLEDKLANRESKISELEENLKRIEEKFREEKVALQSSYDKAKLEVEAYNAYWKQQLDKEMEDIPEKFKSTAELLVKGAGDTKNALEELRKAKKENMFGTKSVTVFHGTPGAKDGARMDDKKIKEEQDKNMTSKQKIAEGLKEWMQGNKR